MRLVLQEFPTLDGVSQGPGSPDEDTSDGFTRGGRFVPHPDEEFRAPGRRLARRGGRLPVRPPHLPELRAGLDHGVLSGDVPAQVAELKRRPTGLPNYGTYRTHA
ncbi:hypothetical protein GCM10022233_34810 [Streptomyces shaanxiensis]|uniref:Uncharacterized protein n=1 Tax=Streptomyces shaanxiensis TaxID=653357 RepID=A0ABP7V411_9ACTN